MSAEVGAEESRLSEQNRLEVSVMFPRSFQARVLRSNEMVACRLGRKTKSRRIQPPSTHSQPLPDGTQDRAKKAGRSRVTAQRSKGRSLESNPPHWDRHPGAHTSKFRCQRVLHRQVGFVGEPEQDGLALQSQREMLRPGRCRPTHGPLRG